MPFPNDETKFRKGNPSPNPNGRPKGSLNRSTIVKKWLEAEEKIKNPITGTQESLTQADIMTLGLIKEARKGNVAAYKELMDSGFGKLTDQLNVTGDVDLSHAIQLNVEFEKPTEPKSDET